MMKNAVRFLGLFLLVAALIVAIGNPGLVAFATEGDGLIETEPNDGMASATPVELNTPYSACVQTSSDEDYFVFTLDTAGFINIDFTPEAVDTSNTHWRIFLYDSNKNNLLENRYTGATGTTINMKAMGLAPGTYYLRIYDNNYYNINYSFQINFTASADYEAEYNDTMEAATPIPVNATIQGLICKDSGDDYYSFTLEQDGYISLSFSSEYRESSSDHWRVYLYDSAKKKITERKFYSKSMEPSTTTELGLPAGTYYLLVTDNAFSNIAYSFSVNYTASTVYETEFNDSITTADPISVNTKYYGAIFNSYEDDYYTFTLDKDGVVNIDFEFGFKDANSKHWEITLYDANNKKMVERSYASNSSATVTVKELGLPAGTYYLLVHDDSYYNIDYSFQVNFTEAEDYETEFNDSFATADPVALGTTYHGNIMIDAEDDYFTFALEKDGYITVDFTSQLVDNSSKYWKVRVYDSNNKLLMERSYASNSSATVTTSELGLPAGTYYLMIHNDHYYDIAYSFQVNFTEASDFETEFNDSFATADPISNQTTYRGCIIGEKDDDYFSFTLPKDGYITVDFLHEFVDSTNEYWTVRVYDINNQQLMSRVYSGNYSGTSTSPVLGLPAGEYYLMVESGSYNYSTTTYSFSVNYTEAADYETEQNNSFATADPIVVNSAYNGSVLTDSDADYFSFSLESDGVLNVDFTHGFVDSSSEYWTVRVYDSNTQQLMGRVYYGNYSGTSTSPSLGLPAGDYYLLVESGNYHHSNLLYTFTVKFEESADYETEFNNQFDTADPISTGRTYHGSTMNKDDKDYFKFTLSEDGTYVLDFSHALVDSSYKYWWVILYDSASQEIQSLECIGNEAAVVSGSKLELTAGDYYVLVKSHNNNSAGLYNLQIREAGHEHQYQSAVTAPTCTEPGFTTYTCDCGDTYTGDETAALGHNFVDGVCTICVALDPDYQPPDFNNPFYDVYELDWYFKPILWAVEEGITSGTSPTTFSPGNTCTRAQVVTFLWRAMGKPEPASNDNPFEDVAESNYFYQAVLWAVEKGITSGTGNGKFSPNQPCTRNQVVTFLWRTMGKPAPESSDNPFEDVQESGYYYQAVLWAVEQSITSGTGEGKFSPGNPCTRAQVVTFLYRTLKDK